MSGEEFSKAFEEARAAQLLDATQRANVDASRDELIAQCTSLQAQIAALDPGADDYEAQHASLTMQCVNAERGRDYLTQSMHNGVAYSTARVAALTAAIGEADGDTTDLESARDSAQAAADDLTAKLS